MTMSDQNSFGNPGINTSVRVHLELADATLEFISIYFLATGFSSTPQRSTNYSVKRGRNTSDLDEDRWKDSDGRQLVDAQTKSWATVTSIKPLIFRACRRHTCKAERAKQSSSHCGKKYARELPFPRFRNFGALNSSVQQDFAPSLSLS